MLAVVGLALISLAWWLSSSPWVRDYILRGKDTPALEAIVAEHPDDALAHYHLAKRYYLDRRFSDASATYREAIRLEPRDARAHLGLALSLYESGLLGEARDEFDTTLRLNPGSAWAEYMEGTIAWFSGRVGDALPHMRRSAELDPRSDQAWYGVGVSLIQLHRYKEAVDALRSAIARNERSPRYHTAMGEVKAYLGDTEAGRREYARALELDPEYGPACGLMGGLYLNKIPGLDSQDRAEKLLLKATRLKSYRPQQVYLDLGELYLRKREYQKAVDALQLSVRIDPRDERPYYSLASAYRRLGNARAAGVEEARFRRISDRHLQMATMEARVFHDPNNATARLNLARLYRDLKMTDRAAEQYSAYLHLDPSDRTVKDEFARTFAERQTAPADRRELVYSPIR